MPISAVIITKNEAVAIERCLDSIIDLVDEIVVVDAESTDATADLCRKRGARVFVRQWQGYPETRNYGVAQASHDFILTIDADQVLSPELLADIRARKSSLEGAYSARMLSRLCGRWVRHSGWYSQYGIRLFDRRLGSWREKIHEHVVLEPGTPITRLPGPIIHYSPLTLSGYIDQVNRYTTLEAERSHENGKKVGFRHLTIRPLQRFLYIYILQRGYRDGFAGYCVAVNSAFYRFLWLAKLWERTRLKSDSADSDR